MTTGQKGRAQAPKLPSLWERLEAQIAWYDRKADEALFSAIDAHLGRHVRLEEMNTDINDPAFAARAVELLESLL